MVLFFLATILCSALILHNHCLLFGLFCYYHLEIRLISCKIGTNKRKRSGCEKEPPLSSDPPSKRPRTRGSYASTSRGGAAKASTPGGAPTTVTLDAVPDNWYNVLPANHGMDMG